MQLEAAWRYVRPAQFTPANGEGQFSSQVWFHGTKPLNCEGLSWAFYNEWLAINNACRCQGMQGVGCGIKPP